MSSVELRLRQEMRDAVRSACKSGNHQPLVDLIKANDDVKDMARLNKACHYLSRRREIKLTTVAEVRSHVIAGLLKDVKKDPSVQDKD